LYIADATVAFWQALLQGMPGEAYNVGTSDPIVSMRTLAQMMARLAGSSSTVQFEVPCGADWAAGGPSRAWPSTAKLETSFGWHAEVGLEEMIRRTMRWVRETVL
jgi:UDP-glucuronate decarboxylase